MKKKLLTLFQVLISVSILAYLFNNICMDVAKEIATELVAATPEQLPQIAAQHELSTELATQVRAQCRLNANGQADLKSLPWKLREQFAWTVGPGEVAANFRRINLLWYGAAIGCFGMVCLLGTLRWRMILKAQDLDLPLGRALSIFFIGHFFNSFMLGATGGDVIKAWYVARETHHKKTEAVGTVIVDRVVGLLALFVVALVVMTVFADRLFHEKDMAWFALGTLVLMLAAVTGTFLLLWRGLADKLPGLRAWLQRLPKYDQLCRLVDSYRAYATRPGLILKTMALSVLLHLFVIGSIVCVAYGLRIHPHNGLADFLLYLPIINTVSAIPISISGLGVREGLYVKFFAVVGVAKAPAFALSLLGYIVPLIWSLVGGIFFLTHRKELPPVDRLETTDAAG